MQKSGCSGEQRSHLLELLPAALPGRLSLAQPPSTAHGHRVLHHTGLDGSQGTHRVLRGCWAPLGLPMLLPSWVQPMVGCVFPAQHIGACPLPPSPTCPAGGSNLHLIVMR